MGGKSNNTTTTVANNAPWEPAQPYLKSNMKAADNLVDKGIGAGVFKGKTVTDWSTPTKQGMSQISNFANSNGGAIRGEASNVLNNGGYNAAQQASMDYFDSAGTDAFDLSGNEAYQRYKSRQLDDVADRTNLAASSMGRYGSGAHTGNLVDSLSGASDAMDMQQFSRLDDLNSQRFNAGQQGIGNMSSAFQMGQLPAQALMGIGAMKEDLTTRKYQSNLNRFNEQQNKPWEQLAKANAIYSGAGSMGGTSTQTAQAPGQSPIATGLGYLSAGSGLVGGLNNLGFF